MENTIAPMMGMPLLKTYDPRKIAIMMGGWSGEREVSLSSAKEIFKVFTEAGYECCQIDVSADVTRWVAQIKTFNPDIVFMNAIHGQWVEDGCMQGILEFLGYPYTGSNLVASALAMDKPWSRHIFEMAGLPIAGGVTHDTRHKIDASHFTHYPYVIKPTNQGSSLGVSIIHNYEDLQHAIDNWSFGHKALIESYIPGRELSVAVLGDRALGVVELSPQSGFYDYESKYTDGKTHHFMPARIDSSTEQDALNIASAAVKALGIEGVSRVDLRFDDINFDPGKLYVLEVNSLPGMTPLSLVPEIAAYHGLSFIKLLEWMIHHPIWPKVNETSL